MSNTLKSKSIKFTLKQIETIEAYREKENRSFSNAVVCLVEKGLKTIED